MYLIRYVKEHHNISKGMSYLGQVAMCSVLPKNKNNN